MLNSATDYKYLDVGNLSSFITGDIFPVRMAREDGSDKRIRYEDYLFALEAQKERYGWNSNPPSTLITPDVRTVTIFKITNSNISQYEANSHGFIDRNYTIPTSTVLASYSTYVKDALGIQNTSLETISSQHYQSISKEIVCKQYWNIKQCNRTLINIPLPNLGTYISTHVTVEAKGQSSPTYASGDFGNSQTIYNTGYATRVGSSNTRYVLYSKQPLVSTVPYAKSATLILICDGSKKAKGSQSAIHTYCAVPLSCTISNGVISTPSLDTVASSAASATGLVYNSSPYYEELSDYNIDIIGAGVIIDHWFPAEIDSITGWDWTPSTTP